MMNELKACSDKLSLAAIHVFLILTCSPIILGFPMLDGTTTLKKVSAGSCLTEDVIPDSVNSF